MLTNSALPIKVIDEIKVKARTVLQAEQPAQPMSQGPETTIGLLQNPPQKKPQ